MIDTMILEEAIKKAKEELALKLESGTSGTGDALAQLKSSLESKLSPWTGTRAAKLDRLDMTVSSRADGSYYTPARASKLDQLDAKVSSRLSKADFDTQNETWKTNLQPTIDAVSRINNRVDRNLSEMADKETTLAIYDHLKKHSKKGVTKVWDKPGSYTWTVPEDVISVTVDVIIAGGGGGGVGNEGCFNSVNGNCCVPGDSGSSGGSGGSRENVALTVKPGDTINVVVGGGGTSVYGGRIRKQVDMGDGSSRYQYVARDGTAGGLSSFASLSVSGGGGGNGGHQDGYDDGKKSISPLGGRGGYPGGKDGAAGNKGPKGCTRGYFAAAPLRTPTNIQDDLYRNYGYGGAGGEGGHGNNQSSPEGEALRTGKAGEPGGGGYIKISY